MIFTLWLIQLCSFLYFSLSFHYLAILLLTSGLLLMQYLLMTRVIVILYSIVVIICSCFKHSLVSVVWRGWSGDRKGILPLKAYTTTPLR